MQRKTKVILTAAVAAAALGAGAAARGNDVPGTEASAAPEMSLEEIEGAEERDVPITGADLDKAKAAALAHLGAGVVTESEVGDEESYYEVEVQLSDGRQVDVQLDESFTVVGVEGEGAGDDD